MIDDDDSLREELHELTVRLRLVRLEQDRIEKAAALIKNRLNCEKNTVVNERNYTDDFVPKIGDHVRIRNPHTDQPPEGIVRGFCSDGKLKIGDTKPFIMRLPKNVAHLTRGV